MADYPDRPGYSFNPGPPPEASRYLRNKGLKPAFSWQDVEPEEHAVAFTVAKMSELDLLEAARGEVQKALDEGLPFEAFKKSWRANPRLADWWGRREMEDPLTGEIVDAQLGSPRRLKTIYDANLRSARAAGQWERIERTKAAFPFLEYRLGPSENHRPHHAAKAGLILPVDSPFWDEWFPPNGWGCKCWVQQVTRAEALRRGVSDPPTIRDTRWENRRTGDRRLVPEGIDPGWERNPGKLRLQNMETMLKDRLLALPEAARRAALRDIATSWRVARIMDGAPGRAPVGMLSASLAGAAGISDRMIWVNSATFEHLVLDHLGDPSDAAFRKQLLALIANVTDAALGAIEVRDDGTRTLRVLIPFTRGFHVTDTSRASRAERPTSLVLWFDDGMRVRSMLPTTERRFKSDANRRGDMIIDLNGS